MATLTVHVIAPYQEEAFLRDFYEEIKRYGVEIKGIIVRKERHVLYFSMPPEVLTDKLSDILGYLTRLYKGNIELIEEDS